MTSGNLIHALYGHRADDDPAFVLPGGPSLSTGDATTAIDHAAGALAACGVRPGDRVSVKVHKCVEAVFLAHACFKVGAILHPMNTAYTPRETEALLADARPRLLVCDPDETETFAAAAATHGFRIEGLRGGWGSRDSQGSRGGWGSWSSQGIHGGQGSRDSRGSRDGQGSWDSQGLRGGQDSWGGQGSQDSRGSQGGQGSFAELARASGSAADAVELPAHAPAALLYTSGTTGRPKGALITHGNLADSAEALAEVWRLGPGDVLLHALPAFHAHGLLTAIDVMLRAGGAVCFLARFEPESVLRALPGCTVIMGVPTHYARLVREPGLAAAAGALRLAVSGSAPLPRETAQEFRRVTGMEIVERYGSTEAAIVTAVPPGAAGRQGWVGWPLPGVRVRVANDRGRFESSAAGVLETRGHNVFAGYWLRPDERAFTEDGWFVTGDVAEIDAQGCVRILGRQTDVVITGGLNVYPGEVEEVLGRCPGVAGAAVFGAPHPDFGEAVVAAVETAPSGEFDESACIRYLKTELASYKTPKRVVPVDAIPRNELGKVVKAELRERFRGLFAGTDPEKGAVGHGR